MIKMTLGYIGIKFLDKLVDRALDVSIDKVTKISIEKEYEETKKIMFVNLQEFEGEDYYKNLLKLLYETNIVKDIFNLSYLSIDLTYEERKQVINDEIEGFFNEQGISSYEINSIKDKVTEQFNWCFEHINKVDDKTRRAINKVILQIANSNSEQKELMHYLKCGIKELEGLLQGIQMKLGKDNIDFGYLREHTKMSIDNLKVRFTQDFNVDVSLSLWLHRFCNTDNNRYEIYTLAKSVLNAITQSSIIKDQSLINEWKELIYNLNKGDAFDLSLLEKRTGEYITLVDDEVRKKYENSESDYYKSNEYNNWRHLCYTNGKLDVHREALNADTLLVTGDAGIGKSHSIAYFIFNEFYEKKRVGIFVLGQHLNEQLDPIIMLEKNLRIPYNLQNFLYELENYAEHNNVFVPFVIEGINEGHCSEIWSNYYEGLIGIFEKYKYIRLIISIRNTYIKKCLPEGYSTRKKTLVINHKGFEDNSIEAVATFFDYYGIAKPTFPILYSEFYNPLFLHTLCKTIQASKSILIDRYSSFNKIFASYINVVEKIVAKTCNYRPALKLVSKVVDRVVKYSFDDNMRYGIKLDEFYEIINKAVESYGIRTTDFINAMCDNGLFYSEVYGWQDEEEEYIQFAYEKYHNILTANYLLQDIATIENLKDNILDGKLSILFNKRFNGIIEELFIIIPERYGVELLDILDTNIAEKLIDEYIKSLIWRNEDSISLDVTKKMINKYVIGKKLYFYNLLNILLIISPIEENPLNANFLHKYLSQFKMADRDHFWVECIYKDTNYGNSVLTNLVKLSHKQKKAYSKETKKLISILLSWSLACTNNIYRDEAVRALVSIFENELDIAEYIIKKFSFVYDGYVKEGIYCAAYGAVIRSENIQSADQLVVTIYNDIFNGEEAYPHVIVRSHARGIIEFLSNIMIIPTIDKSKVIPPYNSKWYDSIPSLEDIKKYDFDYSDKNKTRTFYASNRIIRSMATNTGKKAGMYGDFGRYVFEGWVEPWEYHFLPQDLSNLVVKIIFEQYGYDHSKHGDFDLSVLQYNRHIQKNERIGKKYQRIASFEMLARLSDNFEPGTVNTVFSEPYSEWHSKQFEKFINFHDNEYEIEDEIEEYIEKEDDIKQVFSSYKYNGPWQFNYRGIDPTVLIQSPMIEKNYWEDVWQVPNNEKIIWASKESEEPDLSNILITKFNEEEYIVLEMFNTWNANCIELEKENQREYFVKAIAMLAPTNFKENLSNLKNLKKYAEGRNNSSSYNIFAREYYWSHAYKDYEKIVFEESFGEEDSELIATGFNYSCPASYSGEVGGIISSYSIPSKFLVDKLKLLQLKDGKWYDSNKNLVSFDLNVEGYRGALLFRKSTIKELLEQENLILVWAIYTEKKEHTQFYATRKLAQWDGSSWIIEGYNVEEWTAFK